MNTIENALSEADRLAQDVSRLAESTMIAVRALLLRPDSPSMRLSVLELMERLAHTADDASDRINGDAETFGAHFTDERRIEVHEAVISAVRQGGAA